MMCGVYRDGGSGYGGPAADEKFFDPERVNTHTIHIYERVNTHSIEQQQDFIKLLIGIERFGTF